MWKSGGPEFKLITGTTEYSDEIQNSGIAEILESLYTFMVVGKLSVVEVEKVAC